MIEPCFIVLSVNIIETCFILPSMKVIKSPQSGVTLCFQFGSTAAASAAAAAAMTFVSHVKTVSATS